MPDAAALLPQQPTARQERFGTKFSTAVSGFYKSLDDTFKSFTLTAENGLEQMRTKASAAAPPRGINHEKNGFLTFIFACIPGAGQMYYGYMQRGLSIAMILMLCVMAATVVQPLLFLCLVIWMYSFLTPMTSSAIWQPVSRRRIPCWFRAIMRRSKAGPQHNKADRLGSGRHRRLGAV